MLSFHRQHGRFVLYNNTTTPQPSLHLLLSLLLEYIMIDGATYSVFTSLVVNFAIGVIAMSIFVKYRHRRDIYSPRLRMPKLPHVEAVPAGAFTWISHTLSIPDEDALKTMGLDAFTFLRFVRLFAKLAFHCACIGSPLLLTIYAFAGDKPLTPGIQRVGMGNLDTDDTKLWASFACAWLFSIYALYLLYDEYKVFMGLRQAFLRDGDILANPQTRYSCLLEYTPSEMNSKEWLFTYMSKLFPGQVHSVAVSINVKSFNEDIKKRDAIVKNFEKFTAINIATQESKEVNVDLKTKSPVICYGGDKVVPVGYYSTELQKANLEIESMRSKVKDAMSGGEITDAEEKSGALLADAKPYKLSSTAFVTFKTMRAAVEASQLAVLSNEYPDFRAFPAPSASDILWQNVTSPLKWKENSSIFTSALLYAGMLFWGIVIAFIGAISNLANIATVLPFVNSLDSVSYSLLAGLLPVVVLSIFLSLLPVIFAAIATSCEKHKYESSVQLMVSSWFFLYTMTNVYLILLAGSLFNALSDAIANPLSLADLLGKAIPSVAVFFVNLMIAQMFVGIPLMMLRIGPLLVTKIYMACFDQKKLTVRSMTQGPFAPARINYGVVIPGLAYPVIDTMLYWVISPVILLIAGLYFPFLYVAYKYQLLYVIVPSFQTGGSFFYQLYSYSMSALLISSIATLAFIALKQGVVQAPLLVPIPIIIILVWKYTVNKFKVLSSTAALSFIQAKDVEDADTTSANFDSNFYLQPCYKDADGNFPMVYRIADTPLFNDDQELDDVYFGDTVYVTDFDKDSNDLTNKNV
jgi:hypothetical protein